MLRVRTAWSGWEGAPGLSTFYFITLGEDAAAAIRCRLYVQSLLNGGSCRLMSTQAVGIIDPSVDVITMGSGEITATHTDTTFLGSNGTGGDPCAPIASAGLLRISTATHIAGRRVRGRSFVSPLWSGAVDTTGTLVDTLRATADAGVASALAGFTPGDSLAVWHRPKGGTGGFAAVATGAVFADKIAVLKSRRD